MSQISLRRLASAKSGVLLVVSGLGLSLALSGCVGYVQDDGGGVEMAEPDMFLFGGYGDGYYARDFGRRGWESRGGGGWRGRGGAGWGGRGGAGWGGRSGGGGHR